MYLIISRKYLTANLCHIVVPLRTRKVVPCFPVKGVFVTESQPACRHVWRTADRLIKGMQGWALFPVFIGNFVNMTPCSRLLLGPSDLRDNANDDGGKEKERNQITRKHDNCPQKPGRM